MAIMRNAEPFLFLSAGSKKGALLIHGFTGSPAEMRLAGEHLHKKGVTVLAPRLCGHGSSLAEMDRTNWRHWYGSVEDAYSLLTGLCDEISVIGLSMGALLGIKLAKDYPIAKIAALSAPVYLAYERLGMLPLVKMFRSAVPKKIGQRSDFYGDDLAGQYLISYDATPLRPLASLLELIEEVKKLLPQVAAPMLIIQSKAEHTVRPESAQYIYDNIASSRKELVWLEKSHHVVTLGVEREKVFAEIEKLLLGDGH